MQKPLKGIVVLEFSQYLSGPSAGLRLADLGARVIKIERTGKGDACRHLAINNLWVNETSLLFHTINRNKESFTADLNNPDDLESIKELLSIVDVMTHNFRPGVMEKLGLDYENVKEINPLLIYTEISGYGNKGPWNHKPGQDLLVQSISGLTYASGNKHDNPTPFGLAIGDYLCGNQAVQGILAALIRRRKTGKGALIQLSLLESLIDFQFEFFTTYFLTNKHPERSGINNAHSLLSAPYGIYQTTDGFIAVAMMPLNKLASVIRCDTLNVFSQNETFEKRDEIKNILTEHFLKDTTKNWLKMMQAHDLWVMPVLNWQQLRQTESYQTLQMEQEIKIDEEKKIVTTRCPIRINNEKIFSTVPAPGLGEHTIKIKEELLKQKA
jgi:CoA:oxalate CoA-transferase